MGKLLDWIICCSMLVTTGDTLHGDIAAENQRIEIHNERNIKSNYQRAIESLTELGLEIKEEYSLDKQSERLVIYLPDMHYKEFTTSQRTRIRQIISLFEEEQVALGLEGYYQELTPQFIREANARNNTFEGKRNEEALFTAKVDQVRGSFIGLVTEDPGRKEFVKRLLLEFQDISKYVFMTVSTNKGYADQIHSPGSLYLFENYPDNVHLFGLESEEEYKQCMQKYAEYDNTLKMEYIEILRIKTEEMSQQFNISSKDRRIKDILLLTDALESMIAEFCEKYPQCREYRREQDKTKFRVNPADMSKLLSELDSIRNRSWAERVKALDRKYQVVIIVGGAAHLKSGIYQEIARDNSIITIDTHIERYNPLF